MTEQPNDRRRQPTTDDILAAFDAVLAQQQPAGDYQLPTPLIDWQQAYSGDTDQARWLSEPLIPDGGAVAMFAKGGTGKSLLALWIAAGLSTGLTLTGPAKPEDVLYLDYEMTQNDVVNRLYDMGYTDPDELSRLHYASLPTLPPLDTMAGGQAVLDMARHVGAAVVIVDTFGRAVDGEENGADTVRAWYRWTGQPLKAAGIAFMRIDHAGKDKTKGQRGSSAKNDDVDIVWELSTGGRGSFTLKATKRRSQWIPDTVALTQTEDNGVLAYRWDGNHKGFAEGTEQVAELLEQLGADLTISRREAGALLRSAGHGRRDALVSDALRMRREQSGTKLGNHPGQGFTLLDTEPPPIDHTKPLKEPHGNHPEPPAPADGVGVFPPLGGNHPLPTPEPDDDEGWTNIYEPL